MRKLMGLVIVLTCACEPEPGETKCRTTMVFGVAHTKCKQGPPLQPVEQPTGYWCWERPQDGLGVCHRRIGDCEATRETTSSSGPSSTSSECTYFAAAVCAESGCGPNIASCAAFERKAGRGPNACNVER